jgi:hypothetical protein
MENLHRAVGLEAARAIGAALPAFGAAIAAEPIILAAVAGAVIVIAGVAIGAGIMFWASKSDIGTGNNYGPA